MRHTSTSVERASVAIVLALALSAAGVHAGTQGSSAQGRPFVSGGVTAEELVALHERRDAFSLWVITAARRSGAHLSDVHLRIVDSQAKPVFDDKLDGPWLFIDLALGRYTLEARFNGEVRRGVTTIHSGDHHQAFFYFDVPDEVSPEAHNPFPRNPYGK